MKEIQDIDNRIIISTLLKMLASHYVNFSD